MGGGKRSNKWNDEAKVDDSVPFAFLLGERYSGYKQAINASKDLKGGLNGIGLDGRPIVPERFRPREPFLVVEAEVHTFGAGGRVEKPHERADCGPARRRREIQEMMRARVQVQEDFLAGLERDRREWRRYQTHAAKSGAVASHHRRRQLRLAYGDDPSDGVGSDMTSCVPEFDDARREKQEVARVLKAARQAELKANAECATMRRWEKEVLKTIRSEAANALRTPGTSVGGGREPELTRALYQLSAEHGCAGEDRSPESTAGERLEEREGEENAAPTAARERGGRVAGAQDRPATRAREESAGGRGQPATVVDSGSGTPPEQQGSSPPERSREVGVAAEKTAAAAAGAGAGCADDVAAVVSDMSEEDVRAGEEKQGDDAIKNMVEKLLRTSSSVALAVARPLSVKPPPVLEVAPDPHQANLASRLRSLKQSRFAPAQRATPERTFVGGGFRTAGGGDGGGRRADTTASSSPDGGGRTGGTGGGNNLAATRSSSCPALATGTTGILDLEAVTAAAATARLNGSGGGSGGSGVPPKNLAHHHPRNRFAPMVDSEVERFLLQSWKNDYGVPGKEDGESGAPSTAGSESSADNERKTPNGNGVAAAGGFGAAGGGGGDRASSAVRVVVRVRPQNKKEIEAGGTVCVTFPSEETIELNEAKKTYDRVFDPSATQQEVFDYVAKPLVSDLFDGYNGTIFAYGQTSSGKTHTMEGPSIHDEELAGVIPRTVREIFLAVAEAPDSVEFVIKVSYIEIYMEKIRDLLDNYHTKMNLPVREDKQRGVYVAGATEEYVTSAEELIAVMSAGAKNRVTAATGMNQGSSRSHSVFIISLQQRDVNDSSTKTGMLFLVDLAGSEMVKKTHATGQVLNEAKTINKSLSALGQVINALTDDKKPHVPYRDSKLTRVLQNSLGGNSKTCLIVNCSPSSFNEAETMSTLRFGSRAKRIQNKAVVNETRSVEELSALLAKAESAFDMQQTYIAALEKQLRALKNGGVEPSAPTMSPAAGAPGAEGEGVGVDSSSPAGAAGAEGVRPPQDEEAANAIRLLTKRNRELQAELDEEKAEVKRREQVSNELRQVLQEKESLLDEAANLFREAESVHLARREAFLAEKAEIESDLETQRTHLQEITQRHQFEIEEQSLKLEKLTGENARLAEELREITGDDLPEVTSSSSKKAGGGAASKADRASSPSPKDAPASAEDGAAAAASAPAAGEAGGGNGVSGSKLAHAGDGEAGSPELTGDMAAAAAAASATSGKAASTEGAVVPVMPEGTVAAEDMDKLDCGALESAGASETAITLVVEREERWRERDAKLIAELWRSLQRAQQLAVEKDISASQLAANRQNCEHLAQDLQESVDRRTELELEQDKAAEAQGDADLEKLKKEKIMLQQRLAQLSEVHRRLLWKFGEVELERAAFEKKIRNREVLIKQLEHDLVTAATKLKSQKEETTKKLLAFRQEVAKLEQEAQRQKHAPASHSSLDRRAIRGGGGSHQAQEVKTLRGGNGRRSHDEARPWGGLGFDVKSNTYAAEPGGDDEAAVAAAGTGGPRRSSVGATPRKGLMETSPSGRTRLARGEGFIERLLGSRVVAGTPKY
eukprot:g3286.t1